LLQHLRLEKCSELLLIEWGVGFCVVSHVQVCYFLC
jgi:hypothetical protein